MDAIYEVHGLTKRYGRTAALNGVDFAVTPGKLVGLLGPNGSGKTTLMKISAGLLQPTAGSVIIDKVPVGVFTKAVTSYLPDRMALPTEFTADDAVSLYADFFTDFDKSQGKRHAGRPAYRRAGQNRFHEQGHTGKDAALPDDEPCRQALPAG